MTTQSITSETTAIARTRFTLWHISLLLVLVGIGISGYLSYVKLTDVPMVCAANSVFNCEAVQSSAYSRIFGIPIAWLGLAT
ncbi:MAG: hypothetical protein H7Y11_11375 [Armatimonadetes bacterium]|nr:hypothetical protein [Anaerolineae bacterium]